MRPQEDDETAAVEAAILALFRQFGPLTEQQLVERYCRRALRKDRPLPLVAPRVVRTARSALTGRGALRATGLEGHSVQGDRTTVWAVAPDERARRAAS